MPRENQDSIGFQEIIHADRQVNLHSISSATKVHWPWDRFSIWTQECLKRCEWCTNPHMLDSKIFNLSTYQELIDQIRMARDSVAQIEWITLQWWEPMLQARNLVPILERMKIVESPELNTLTFTWYRLEELQELNNSAVNDLLALTDTLIDWEYDRTKPDKKLIRWSTNQRIIHLTDILKNRDFRRKWKESTIKPMQWWIIKVQTWIAA